MGQPPTLETIRQAERRILPYLHRTPVLTCSAINDRVEARLFFKCENSQRAGAFKMRGAVNVIAQLTENEREVIAASTGNFGQGIMLDVERL